MRAILVLAITVTLSCGCVSAQPSTGAMPFGLDKFHWLMTSKEASEQFPAIAPRLPNSARPYFTNQAGVFLGPYKWRDCTFTAIFWFGYEESNRTYTSPPSSNLHLDILRPFKPIDPSKDALSSIELRMPDGVPASSSCLGDFQQELRSHFETSSPAGKTDGRVDWSTPTTNAFSVQASEGRFPTAWLLMFGKDAPGLVVIN
jgi:hypothetical protein